MNQHVKKIFIAAPTSRGASGSPLVSHNPKISISGNAATAACKTLIELAFLDDSFLEPVTLFLSLSETTTVRHPTSIRNPTPSPLGEMIPRANPYASANAHRMKHVVINRRLFQNDFSICTPAF
jgi:hypothetical protein